MKNTTVDLLYITPGPASFEYQGKTWNWKKTASGLEHVGTDRRGLWGVFTNGTEQARIYRGDLIDALGNDAAAQIFNRQPYPDKCYAYVATTGQIGVITRGERGYKPVSVKIAGLDSHATVDRLNTALGVSKAHAAAMMAGSLFGWDCPAANPKNYDRNGNAIQPKKDSRDVR